MFHVATLILECSWLEIYFTVAQGGLSCLEMWLQHRLRLGELGVWAEPGGRWAQAMLCCGCCRGFVSGQGLSRACQELNSLELLRLNPWEQLLSSSHWQGWAVPAFPASLQALGNSDIPPATTQLSLVGFRS